MKKIEGEKVSDAGTDEVTQAVKTWSHFGSSHTSAASFWSSLHLRLSLSLCLCNKLSVHVRHAYVYACDYAYVAV